MLSFVYGKSDGDGNNVFNLLTRDDGSGTDVLRRRQLVRVYRSRTGRRSDDRSVLLSCRGRHPTHDDGRKGYTRRAPYESHQRTAFAIRSFDVVFEIGDGWIGIVIIRRRKPSA